MAYILVVDDDPEESPSSTYFDAVNFKGIGFVRSLFLDM